MPLYHCQLNVSGAFEQPTCFPHFGKGNDSFPIFNLQLPPINEYSISIDDDCNTQGDGWSKLGKKVVKWRKKKASSFFHSCILMLKSFFKGNISIFSRLRHIPTCTDTEPPTYPPLGFPSASEMWVNEAPPGGTVNNTYTTSLIRGRGG